MKQDQFSYTIFDRGGSIWSDFVSIHAEPRIFLRLILGISLAERSLIGYDSSISGKGINRRVKLDLYHPLQGLGDLTLQLVLYMTGKVNGRGSTVRLLQVTDDQVANFYGCGGKGYKSPPGMRPGDNNFGIISKDTWDDPYNDLSEGIILQLLHAKGVRGAIWCLDEKPVVVPDAPPLPANVLKEASFEPRALLDNTIYIRSRWGIRSLLVLKTAMETRWTRKKQEEARKQAAAVLPVQTRRTTLLSSPIQVAPTPRPGPSRSKFADFRDAVKDIAKGMKPAEATKGKKKAAPPPSPSPSSSLPRPSTELPSTSGGMHDEAKGKEKAAPPPSPSSSPSCTPPYASGRIPNVGQPEEQEPPFRLRSHIRSYMYPVGTPVYWFASLLELLCVFRDLLCSTYTM